MATNPTPDYTVFSFRMPNPLRERLAARGVALGDVVRRDLERYDRLLLNARMKAEAADSQALIARLARFFAKSERDIVIRVPTMMAVFLEDRGETTLLSAIRDLPMLDLYAIVERLEVAWTSEAASPAGG